MSNAPLFTEPHISSGRSVSEAPSIDRPTLVLQHGDDPLEIANFSFDLAGPTPVRERTKFVNAAAARRSSLSEDGLHAVARAIVSPEAASAMVKADLFTDEIVEAARLRSLPAIVYTTELFPLLQPRTAASALPVPGPKVHGIVTEDGTPSAALELSFRNMEHLEMFLRQTVRETRRAGKRYDESILARRVSRPVIAHEARLTFSDGSEHIDVLVVRDGLTRVVSATAARLHGKPTPDQIADEMVRTLLTRRPTRGKEVPLSQEYARGREAIATELRARFARGIASGAPSEDAIRVGQTFSMPAQVYTSIEPLPGNPLPAERQFDDAIRAVVSSIHVEFKGWDEAAEFAEVADRAMQRVRHSSDLSDDVADLAAGLIEATSLPTTFRNAAIPKTQLWRAVYLLAAMCDPTTFAAMKRELRAILGLTRIHDTRYVALLAPIVDLPWRREKAATLPQARSAWADGGPLPREALGLSWRPVPVSDFSALIPLALAGDVNARLTLQVAGGVALITDKLLTSNVGSKYASGLVPFRASVNDIVSGLGQSERGLWLLARAANAFDAGKSATNSFTQRELNDSKNAALISSSYRVPQLDPDDPSALLLDNAGQPALLTELDIFTTSSPTRADEGIAKRLAESPSAGALSSETPAAEADRMRLNIRTGVAQALDNLDRLVKLVGEGKVTSVLDSHDEWQSLVGDLTKLQAAVYVSQPVQQTSKRVSVKDAGERWDDEDSDAE